MRMIKRAVQNGDSTILVIADATLPDFPVRYEVEISPVYPLAAPGKAQLFEMFWSGTRKHRVLQSLGEAMNLAIEEHGHEGLDDADDEDEDEFDDEEESLEATVFSEVM